MCIRDSVGYTVGGGYAVEWRGFNYGCVKTKIKGRGWTHWYKPVSYTHLDVYKRQARQNGWMSANDIRELENLNPLSDEEGGNLYLVNGNMIPITMTAAGTGKEGADAQAIDAGKPV